VINAIVLAAGESKRMGMPKPLLRFPRATHGQDARATKRNDTTFLEQIVSVLQRSDVDRIMVILGAQAARIQASADLSGADVVLNEDYRKGQLSSLIAGLKSLPSRTEAVLLCLVDNPLITGATVNRIVQTFHETGRPIVIPVFGGRRGHPALFARPMFDELLNAPVDKGARHVVHSHIDEVFDVGVTDSSVLARIDTPEDYLSHFGMAPRIIER
jgi:molybdenum cofactor cytidylyltransferase